MQLRRRGLSSVYGFIVIFTLLMAGFAAALTIMDSQASVWNAQDRARQIETSQQAERLSLSLNGTLLTVQNVGLAPAQLSYLLQQGASTSRDLRIGDLLQEGSNLTIPVTSGMIKFAVITASGNVFWLSNSTDPQSQAATVPITFDASGLDPSYGSSSILTVDGVSLQFSALPKTFEWSPGSTHTYSYADGFANGQGSRVGWSYARGLSPTISGSVKASLAGSIIATYGQQFLLSVSGGFGVQFVGSPSGDGWYGAGTTAQVRSTYSWGLSGGSRQNLETFSLDGSSPTAIARSGAGTYTSIGVTMSAPHSIALGSITQYMLNVSGGAGITTGGSQTSDGWFDSGSSASATTSYVWGGVSGQSRSNLVSWALDGGPSQSVPRASGGSYTTPTISMNAYHSLSFGSVTQYQVSVRGAVANGSASGLVTSYSYHDSAVVLSNGLSNVGFESGGLAPWYLGPTSMSASAGITSSSPHSGSYSAFIWLQDGNCRVDGCGGQLEQQISLPPNSIVTSITSSVWYYVSSPTWAVASITDTCGGSSAGGTSGTWAPLSYNWSGSCPTSSLLILLQAGETSQAANYYVYFDDVSVTVTYATTVSGSTAGPFGSLSVNGTTVTYTYSVGYNFPSGSTSTAWSANWPSTESYSSSTCLGASVSGYTISGASGPCTLITKRSGSFGLTMGPSPTGDGWYDTGSQIPVSAAPTGPFAFGLWSTTGGLQVASANSASTVITVNSYGVITADFNVSG